MKTISSTTSFIGKNNQISTSHINMIFNMNLLHKTKQQKKK